MVEKKKGMRFYTVATLWEICAGPRFLENLNPNLRSLCIERKVLFDVIVYL